MYSQANVLRSHIDLSLTGPLQGISKRIPIDLYSQ